MICLGDIFWTELLETGFTWLNSNYFGNFERAKAIIQPRPQSKFLKLGCAEDVFG